MSDKNIEKGIKNKRDSKKMAKIILILFAIVVIVCGLLAVMIISEEKNEERINNITFFVSNDYSYFDTTIDDLFDKVKYRYRDENINANLREYNEGGYQYVIKLSNGDAIYIKTKNKKVIEIKYDFSKNLDGMELGFFIGVFSANALPNILYDDFKNCINDDFLSLDNLFKEEETSYVYKHILYEMHLTFGYSNDYINNATLIIKPTKEETNEEFQEVLKNEKKKKLAQKEKTFTAGTYTVGIDIEPGKYNMIAIAGRGNCFVYSSSKVIETFTPGGDDWAIDNYKNVVLTAGGTIEVTSTLQIKFEPVD